MKTCKALFFLSILAFFACSNVSKNDPVIDNRLSELLKNKNFFKLQRELSETGHKLSADRLLYYKTYCAKVFGDGQQSNIFADSLLNFYGTHLSDTIKAELLGIKSENFINNYQYAEASDLIENLLKQYSYILDSSEIADYKNSRELFGTIADTKPQTISKQNDVKISAYRNRFDHLMTPIVSGKLTDEFIFDTGANLSTITESCAKKMGFKVYESGIKVGTSTQITVQTKLAVADSFYVGDILFENVVFLVAPDETMTFPQLNYEIHGIIGFPVIRQMDEIRMYKDGTIMVPLQPQNSDLRNMYLDGLSPVVQMLSNNDTLLFKLDTGARRSELSKRYFNNHKAEVERNGKLQLTRHGGGGGIVEMEDYELQNFPYAIGTKTNILSSIRVTLKELEFLTDFDGNLGQDVFTQYNEMILNFQSMYLDFD